MFRRISASLAGWALALICLGSFGLMIWASRTDSAIDDELAHIPAGYGYVHNLDYRLNPEHPPLVKALAMLPVLFLNPVYPTQNQAWTKEINGQWDMGTAFLYQSGNDANAIIRMARIMPILLTVLTIILVYLLARSLIGDWWGLLPAFLFAFDPTILAHGHYVTTDVGAAFGVILSLFFYLRFIESPTTRRLWAAGIAFGVGQLTKFSTPLVTVLFLLLAVILWARDALIRRRFTAAGLHRFRDVILLIVIGYVFVVYPVYFLFTSGYPIGRQAADTTALLSSFGGGPTPAGQWCHGMRCLADLDIAMSKHYLTRPYAQYLLGILMDLQRVDAGNTIYFLGRVVDSGGWIYFPVLFLLKEPIPTLAIVLFGLGLSLWWIIRRSRQNRTFHGQLTAVIGYLETNFGEFSLGLFALLYWAYSLHTPLNIGIRHILPTLPLLYILAAGAWKRWVTYASFEGHFAEINLLATGNAVFSSVNESIRRFGRSIARAAAKYIILIILLAWLLLETLFAAPYFLSYYNEFGGGIQNGYHFVTDSNYDWGQDLLRLKAFVEAHPEINLIAVDYFGGGNPHYELGSREIDWSSAKGNPADHGIHWFAVSIDILQNGIQPLGPGQTRNASNTFSWLTALRPASSTGAGWPADTMGNVPAPDYRVGTSIFIYHL